jgi:hypothetical protein
MNQATQERLAASKTSCGNRPRKTLKRRKNWSSTNALSANTSGCATRPSKLSKMSLLKKPPTTKRNR